MHLCYCPATPARNKVPMPRSSSAPAERLLAAEILLLWEGRVSRGRLLDFFAIHPTLASRDLASFQKENPDFMHYDGSSKAYIARPYFCPLRTRGSFSEYLDLLGASQGAPTGSPPPHLGVPFESTRIDATQITHTHFRLLHQAISANLAVEIDYQSLKHPSIHRRQIEPHAFCQAGSRWHVRAYCCSNGEFRDFNLGRIRAVHPTRTAASHLQGADLGWNTKMPLRLIPHEALNPAQVSVVRHEYLFDTSALVVEARACMALYVVQAYRAAIDPERERPPEHLLMVDSPTAAMLRPLNRH